MSVSSIDPATGLNRACRAPDIRQRGNVWAPATPAFGEIEVVERNHRSSLGTEPVMDESVVWSEDEAAPLTHG